MSRQQLPPEIKEVEYKTARPDNGCAITANVVENAPKTLSSCRTLPLD